MQFIKQTALNLLDTLLPPRCAASGEIVSVQGATAPRIWRDLHFIADPFCKKCGVPFDFALDTGGGDDCSWCVNDPPPFTSARSAIMYNDASRDLLLGFKHADKTYAVQTFVPWLKIAGAEIFPQVDYCVPVPLHYWRMVKRRYNQAALIADQIGKATNIAVLNDALIRRRSTQSQGHLSAPERMSNVSGAFQVNPRRKPQLEGKTILLLDDVYTTGATVKECTKTLLAAGVKSVHVLTVARAGRADPLRL